MIAINNLGVTYDSSLVIFYSSWMGWNISDVEDKEFLFPSLSRSYHLPHDPKEKFANELFSNKNTFVNELVTYKIFEHGFNGPWYFERYY